jgi:hypothetical protein
MHKQPAGCRRSRVRSLNRIQIACIGRFEFHPTGGSRKPREPRRALEAGKPTSSLGSLCSALWLLDQLDVIDRLAAIPATLAGMRSGRLMCCQLGSTVSLTLSTD